MSHCAVCHVKTRFGAGHCARCWALVNTDGTEAALNALRRGAGGGDAPDRARSRPGSGADEQPSLGFILLLALPAIAYFPLEAVVASTRPPSQLWHLAERLRYAGLLAPFTALPALWLASRYRPLSRVRKYVAWGAALVTAAVALTWVPLILLVLGIA